MYNLIEFGDMIRDHVRINAFTEALRRAIRPGDVVIDIGAGTGILSLLACQMGAAHVYALEPNPFVALGDAFAAANGFSDRIEFLQRPSTEFSLTQSADVIVGDLRGALPFHGAIVHTFKDARERLLKPGGIIVPQQDQIFASFLQQEEWYQTRVLSPWMTQPNGLNLTPGLRHQTNSILRRTDPITPEMVILPGQLWHTLDYTSVEQPNASNTLYWQVEAEGTAHFVYLWFSTDLYQGIGYSSAPGLDGPTVYGGMLLPLQAPVPLTLGDHISLNLSARLINDAYHWFWSVSYSGTQTGENPVIAIKWDHSTLFSLLPSGMTKAAP